MRLLNFENWSSVELLKIGHNFLNFRKLSDSKIEVKKNCEKCALKLIFLDEKKNLPRSLTSRSVKPKLSRNSREPLPSQI